MRPFNLEEYLANPSKKVITRGGSAVKIHCTNYRYEKPIIAEIEGSGQSISYNKDGCYFPDGESVRDLFFNGEKHEGWINIYKMNSIVEYITSAVYNTKSEAEKYIIKGSTYSYVNTIKIEWEE